MITNTKISLLKRYLLRFNLLQASISGKFNFLQIKLMKQEFWCRYITCSLPVKDHTRHTDRTVLT